MSDGKVGGLYIENANFKTVFTYHCGPIYCRSCNCRGCRWNFIRIKSVLKLELQKHEFEQKYYV